MISTRNGFRTARRLAASGCVLWVVAWGAGAGCDRPTDSASPATTAPSAPPVPSTGAAAAADPAPAYGSNLELVDCTTIAGWVWDGKRPNTPLKVDVYDGDALLGTATADLARKDLSIRVTVAGTNLQLSSSPKSLTCEPGESRRSVQSSQ